MNKSIFAMVPVLALWLGCADGESTTPAAGPPASGNAVLISSVQGSGTASPLLSQTITVSAIVTGDFQDNDDDPRNNLGGFYVQHAVGDDDPATSDGVFVFDGDNPGVDVDVGDRVEVSGTVIEHFGETQISAASVVVTGTGSVQPTDVLLPSSGLISNSDDEPVADLERFEGMLIHFPQQLGVSNLRSLEQYGEIGLSSGNRAYQFTNANPPDANAYAEHRSALGARSIVLDDGQRTRYPEIIRYLSAGSEAAYSIRIGDSVSGLTGNLRYSRGSGGGGQENWRVMPSKPPVFDDDNPRPGAPDIAGDIRVASFNVLNFFSGLDTGEANCGPAGDQNCRGADNAAELDRQLRKTITALEIMDADIIGLIELENNASASIAMIVDSLNQSRGNRHYEFVDTSTIGIDAIKTGFVYNTATIRTSGAHALLNSTIEPRFDDSRNRPALAQTFEVTDTGAKLTIVVNHLKSKGSSCDPSGDANIADGQGNCNLTRTTAAAALAEWTLSDPTSSNDPDVLIIGDLNAYLMEDPIAALKRGGFVSLLETRDNPYSFVFDAQAGALDHALATGNLVSQVAEIMEWHINADEPPLLDYNLENARDASLFDPNSPYRASDHDPIIIGLDLTN